ncbi:hypothetical protein [Pediococcus acidilactici]|uniref:hypothetical protein n=1 Tax=Pediococcus acidilactici TaxID=1254 RepID=UPI0034A06553
MYKIAIKYASSCFLVKVHAHTYVITSPEKVVIIISILYKVKYEKLNLAQKING